jgi:hypothetical protein
MLVLSESRRFGWKEMDGCYPPDKMGIKTTESSFLIKLSRLPAFSLMRIIIFVSGNEEGNISLKGVGFSKLNSIFL